LKNSHPTSGRLAMARIVCNISLCSVLVANSEVKGQQAVSMGISGAYNIPLEYGLVGLRAEFPLGSKFSLGSQVKYIPNFNDFHEFSVGPALIYHINGVRKVMGYRQLKSHNLPGFYFSAGLNYHRWINYKPSLKSNAKSHNLLPELGAGIRSGISNWQVFLECKYNILWLEPEIHVGINVFPFIAKKNRCFY
jgi:hypothetical protein